MTAKEYLGQAYRIDQRINSKMEQIASLNLLAQKATTVFSDMLLIDKETRGREIRWKKPKETGNDREKRRNRAVCERKEVQVNKNSAGSGCQSLSALFLLLNGKSGRTSRDGTEPFKAFKRSV